MQKNPSMMETAAGVTKLIMSNSKYIKSNINGIRHMNPIPIINIPEFLATILKSVCVIYLINVII